MEKNIYFEAVPGIGDLSLEVTILTCTADDPILFTCTDTYGTRFLCSCCKLGEHWLIGEDQDNLTKEILNKKLTFREAFSQCKNLSFITWNGEELSRSVIIPETAYPRDSYLKTNGQKILQMMEYHERMNENDFS